jgi:hypothetical protein
VCPDQARVTQYHGEEPDDAFCARLIGEHDLEAREIDLGLLASCCLEADLEGCDTASVPSCSGNGILDDIRPGAGNQNHERGRQLRRPK